MSLDELRTKK